MDEGKGIHYNKTEIQKERHITMRSLTGFMHGVNLGGWMSQCDYSEERLNGFIAKKDFETIAAWGLDHVRLPFDYNIIETEDGSALIEDGFRRIGEAIANARANGLNIVLDLHKTAGFSFDAGEKQAGFFEDPALQERFYRILEEMAKRFGSDPEHVAFELLNEVTDKAYSKTWNAIAKECIRRIRTVAPQTIVLVGSYWNNHASAVKDLDAPYDDRVVYNFHCYDPLFYTHQGAYWVDVEGFDIDRRMTWAESGATEEFFENLFAEPIAVAEKNGTALYCGEYGVIDTVSGKEALPWYKAICTVFEKHGIGRAAWTWKEMDFELCGSRIAPVKEELKKLL